MLKFFQRAEKKPGNMKVTVITVVIGVLGIVSKGLKEKLKELELGGKIETVQTSALLGLTRILRRVM